MIQKLLLLLLAFTCLFLFSAHPAQAIEDPLRVPNNKVGIHLLFDSELPKAAELVNSNGGDWGYILIPMQINDRNKVKWQAFMTAAKKSHLIPIVRLSTEMDPATPGAWRKPTATDIIDFANFLNTLEWPVKNRYVIVFNEVNRGDEWGGNANPKEYAEILSFAVTVFKSKDQNFFIISSGMDNAAPSQGTKYMNQYDYLTKMHTALPNIFQQIDGISSHSYPNPGFSQPPETTSLMGTGSFYHERALIKGFTPNNKELPIFITETGWDGEVIPDEKRAEYYQTAFTAVWNDPAIVTVMPFLLQATGPFEKFTFLKADGTLTKQYEAVRSLPKIKGTPVMAVKKVLAAKTKKGDVVTMPEKETPDTLSEKVQSMVRWMMGL